MLRVQRANMRWRTLLAGIALALAWARAADASGSYSLFSPVPDDQLRPLCTDRPGKATSACTVDAGRVQIEIDAFDETLARDGPLSTTTIVYGSPTLKLGLDDATDAEITLVPWTSVHTRDDATGARTHLSGFGDLMLHGKFMLTGNGETFTAALDPFLTLPSATSGLGDGAVEGGLVVPLGYALSDIWSIGTTPELDILENAAGGGYHPSLSDVVALNRQLGDFTLGAELWGNWNFDPAGTSSQYSLDVTVTWQPPMLHDLQLDGGANFALNRNTPRTELYMGISKRL